jgi:tetratricopeptide (TPR) repeat protein
MQAVFIEKDPIFPETDARDLVKDVRARAAQKDPELWWPRFWLALDEADKAGLPEATHKISALADQFREVPDIVKSLASMYAKLGWRVEHVTTVKEAAARFPDDVEVLSVLRGLLAQEGRVAEADAIAAHIRKLDPDSEIELEKAIDRRDYAAAITELRRLGSLRKDRKDIALRIADLLTRAGKNRESLEQLERALAKDPDDPSARLALADARYARGERDALQKALIESIRRGAETDGLRGAIELIDGTTELSPYREDGVKVIAQYEASGQTMPGTAARVLDYSAIWVHSDGSARMLEHEIIRIQSREAIQEHAEQQVPRGLVLKLRTVKRDGSVLEPEFVEGKPTVTMPHLEMGDYIETESIVNLRGDGRGGRTFQGPRWFFREEKVPYWRSEFVVITPKNRPLDVETGGELAPPQVTDAGALVTRRWRVDQSPALPEEPGSAPLAEFIPNVRIGWGLNLADTLARMVDAASDETPRDPRLIRVARTIAFADERSPKPPAGGAARPAPADAGAPSRDEQARRIYRWVLANVEAGRETDGRRVVIGKSGNRTEAFVHLCRLLGIDASYGIVRDRLTAPPRGPMSEAESFNALAVRVDTSGGQPGARAAGPVRWMVVREKFAPYGYLPSSLRGQPAVLLRPGAPREVTPSAGGADGLTSEGVAEVAADGSATLEFRQSFEGKLAIALRSALETLPDARLRDTIEAKLLPQALPGARLDSIEIEHLTDLDEPLVLAMKVRTSNFAQPREGELVISPPFLVHLANLAALPARETPLYISEQIATRAVVRLRVKLPPGARVTTRLAPLAAEDAGRTVKVNDRLEKGELVFDRVIDLPAGRVQPDAYRAFQHFARSADAALSRDVVVALGGGR